MALDLIVNKSQYNNFIYRHLSFNYSNINSEYNQMLLEQLINSRPSHYYAVYKDNLTWNDTLEYCQCYYEKIKSLKKLPMITAYHLNYVRFFCRPFIWNISFDHILQTYTQKIAKLFYKKSYGKMEDTNEEGKKERKGRKGHKEKYIKGFRKENGDVNDDIMNDNNDSLHAALNNEEDYYDKTIFNSSARKIIDYNNDDISEILNTQCDNNINNNSKNCFPNSKNFFTVGTHDDFLFDLLNNLSSKQNNNNINSKKIRHSSDIILFSPIMTPVNKDMILTKKDFTSNIIHRTKKTKMKMSYCTIYKQASLIKPEFRSNPSNQNNNNINTNSNTHMNNNNKPLNEIKAFELHTPKFPINSKFSEFKKFTLHSQSKSKQNSYTLKSINNNEHNNTNHKLYYTTNYNNKSSRFKYSIENKSIITFKSPIVKISKQSLIDNQYKKTSKSKITHHYPILKDTTNLNTNLLITYYNNCYNSHLIKHKGNSYLSLRNFSNDKNNNKSFPLQKNHLIKPKAILIHQKSYNSCSNINMFMITHDQKKDKKKLKHQITSNLHSFKSLSKDNDNSINKKNKINNSFHMIKAHLLHSTTSSFVLKEFPLNNNSNPLINNTQGNNLNSGLTSACFINNSNSISNSKGMLIQSNQSQSNVFADKIKKANTSEVEKYINSIKKHFNSNQLLMNSDLSNSNNSNCCNNKNNKSIKYNDSSQTSSNTHNYNYSKSPKINDKMKNEYNAYLYNNNSTTNSNSNVIKRYGNKSSKASQHSFAGNNLKMFFSQRK